MQSSRKSPSLYPGLSRVWGMSLGRNTSRLSLQEIEKIFHIKHSNQPSADHARLSAGQDAGIGRAEHRDKEQGGAYHDQGDLPGGRQRED